MRLKSAVFIMLMFFVILPVEAQGDWTVFVSRDGKMSFDVPPEWEIYEEPFRGTDFYIITNNQTLREIDIIGGFDYTLVADDVIITIVVHDISDAYFSGLIENSSQDLLLGYELGRLLTGRIFLGVTLDEERPLFKIVEFAETQILGEEVSYLVYQDTVDNFLTAIAFDSETYLVLNIKTTLDALDLNDETILRVINSIEYE